MRDKLVHCFPRNWQDFSNAQSRTAYAAQILQGIFSSGILLTPEVVKIPRETRLDDRERPDLMLVQLRCCFTLINDVELAEHMRCFGPIGIRFDILSGRKMGASPVSYFAPPRGESNEAIDTSAFYVSLLHRLYEAESVLSQLHQMSKPMEPEPKSPGSNKIDSSIQMKLCSTSTLQEFRGAMSKEYEGFADLAGALRFATQYMYPTEHFSSNKKYSDQLFYYAQKEWRIVAGLVSRLLVDVRDPTPEEASFLRELNSSFFCGIPEGIKAERWESCLYLNAVNNRAVVNYISDVVVHKELLDVEPLRRLCTEYDVAFTAI